MPHLLSNIPSTIFYEAIFSELLQIARCTQIINDFIPRTCDVFSRMIAQGENKATLTKQLTKTFHRYPTISPKLAKRRKSKTRVTSSNPRVRRLKARVARLKGRVGTLKARVGRLKARVRRLKARAEAIKPRVR